MAFSVRIHKYVVAQIKDLSKERREQLFKYLSTLREAGRNPKQRASQCVTAPLPFPKHNGFDFFLCEVDGQMFRLEVGITPNPQPTLVVLRIAFRTSKLDERERVYISSDGRYFDETKQKDEPPILWFADDD